MGTRSLTLTLILAIAVVVPNNARCEPYLPNASIQVDSGSFLQRLGFQLIEATVDYENKLYRVRLYGIQAGPNGYHASGKIYGLAEIDDIVGRYEAADDGRVLINEEGVEIVMSPPVQLGPGYVYVDYLGSLYARHDQSVQFGPRD